jgi:anti-anti-sigma factor
MLEQHPKSIEINVRRPDPAISTRTDVAILKVAGELGLSAMLGASGEHTGVSGDTALAKLLHDALPVLPPLVIIELSGVTYLSSLGMGALLRFQNDVKEAGGTLRLAGLMDMVAALLRRCRLDHAFHIYPDVASAIKD